MAKFGIGQALTRREDQRLITGTGQYIDDLSLPNEVHMVFLRSAHAHARIVSIDTASAKAAPGVIAVLTGAEMAKDGIGAFPLGPGLVGADGKPAARRRTIHSRSTTVRFVGEAVVAVVAQTLAQAEDAAELVAVEYQELPAVTTISAALAAGRTAGVAGSARQRSRADAVGQTGGLCGRVREARSTSPSFRFTTNGSSR